MFDDNGLEYEFDEELYDLDIMVVMVKILLSYELLVEYKIELNIEDEEVWVIVGGVCLESEILSGIELLDENESKLDIKDEVIVVVEEVFLEIKIL